MKKYYDSQTKHWDKIESLKHSEDWLQNNTLDRVRHSNMRSNVLPLLSPKDKWLTIGDGKYGLDAQYLLVNGVKNVLASDINTKLLIKAKSRGIITEYKMINAEHINLPDNSYDFVFCKESYHHFPRPSVALYEMLRVTRKGVVLIEPQDARSMVSRRYQDSFEPSGNYVYRISTRELKKMSTAIGLHAIAWKQIDDIYIDGIEKIKYDKMTKEKLIINSMLLAMDLAHKLHLRRKNMIATALFKEKPCKKTISKLTDAEFVYEILPKNPYLK